MKTYEIVKVYRNNREFDLLISVIGKKELKKQLTKLKSPETYRLKNHIVNGGSKDEFYLFHRIE